MGLGLQSSWRIAAAIGTCVALGTASQAAAQQRPAPAVVVEPAALSDLRPSVSFTGRLNAIQRVEVRARISGFLQETRFTEGDIVSAGDVLYLVEPDQYQAIVDQTQGDLEAATADKTLAELEVGRKQTLLDRDVVSQAEVDVAIANVGRADGAVKRIEAQLDQAKLNLSYTEITAPFDGIVGLSNVDVGAFLEPSRGALTTLTRLHPMTVEFPVTSAQVLNFQIQNASNPNADDAVKVELILPNGDVYDKTGDVDFVDAAVNQSTDTVTVRAVFDNPDGLLLDGALVGVRLEQDTPELVINVAQAAVQRDQLGAFVMVVSEGDSTVSQRRVESPRVTEGRAVIASGLEEGELVITEGVNKVRPGIVVDAAVATDES